MSKNLAGKSVILSIRKLKQLHTSAEKASAAGVFVAVDPGEQLTMLDCLNDHIKGNGKLIGDKLTMELEADAMRRKLQQAKKAASVLYDALLAYMEPAGDTPEQIRAQAKAALELADTALPGGPALLSIHGHG